MTLSKSLFYQWQPIIFIARWVLIHHSEAETPRVSPCNYICQNTCSLLFFISCFEYSCVIGCKLILMEALVGLQKKSTRMLSIIIPAQCRWLALTVHAACPADTPPTGHGLYSSAEKLLTPLPACPIFTPSLYFLSSRYKGCLLKVSIYSFQFWWSTNSCF